MLTTTTDAIKSMLKADPSITPEDRKAILATVKNHGRTENTTKPHEGSILVTRKQAAAMLGRSPGLVDLLANSGSLPRVTFPGRKRAAGFRRADVVALIEGQA